jgi:XTP/dITP diphosphohydrolase
MKLLIATRNRGKKAEYADLFDGLDLELVSLADLGIEDEVPEHGATFAENALVKARAYAALSGLATLADDSGLEVDVLGGAPGVYSARYGGEGASDEDRYRRLLAELEGIPEGQRTARFRCVIAVVWPNGRKRTISGTCEGRISLEPRGEHGFGYDPIFYVPEYARTMAELAPETKNRISHRARAALAARPLLAEDLD